MNSPTKSIRLSLFLLVSFFCFTQPMVAYGKLINGEDGSVICKNTNEHRPGECEKTFGKCCDAIPEIVWDAENSSEVINESGSVVSVTGGDDIIKWTIAGSGFYFDAEHTLTEIETVGKSVTVYRKAEACTAEITARDDCTDVSKTVRGAGGWVLMPEGFVPDVRQLHPDYQEGCGGYGTPGHCPSWCYYVATEGIYKVKQAFCRKGEGGNSYVGNATCEIACQNVETVEHFYNLAKSSLHSNPELSPEFISMVDILNEYRLPNLPPNYWRNFQLCGEDYICNDKIGSCDSRPSCYRNVEVLAPAKYQVWKWVCPTSN